MTQLPPICFIFRMTCYLRSMDCPHRGDQNDGHVAKTVLEWKPQGKGQTGSP